jgi:thioredoxin reductase (NADPH)
MNSYNSLFFLSTVEELLPLFIKNSTGKLFVCLYRSIFIMAEKKVVIISRKEIAKGFMIKEFLHRNLVPFDYLEYGETALAKKYLESTGKREDNLPVVIFSDGTVCEDPELFEVAHKIGLCQKPQQELYDLAIMGAGPAGLTAAVYAGSEGINTLVIERHSPGGRVGSTSLIENLIGHPKGITGKQFAANSREQAEKFGVEFISPVELTSITRENGLLKLSLSSGFECCAKTLIIAVGVKYRMLNVPGAARLTGAGVYYGSAMTEGKRNKDKIVYVVGGANSAGQAAMYFSRFAEKVNLVIRGESLDKRMSEYLIKEISEIPNITILNHSEIVAVNGEAYLETIDVRNLQSGETTTHRLDSLFLLIGGDPYTEKLAGTFLRDPNGYLLTGNALEESPQFKDKWNLTRRPSSLETNIPGVFAAGDVRLGSAKRMAAAIGDGANAIQQAIDFLAAYT